MNTPSKRIELPPEAEPARDFIEQLVGRYEARIAVLEAQVRDLTEQVRRLTPHNSSIPPSSEHPHANPVRKKPQAAKRKQGGQSGHRRHVRELIPSEQCSAVVDCIPRSCRRCGGELQLNTTTPHRHQVWDLPPIQPFVIEYRQHRGSCPCCGITTLGTLPDGVPSGQCGTRLAAFTGLLLGHFRQSKRRAS